MTDKMPWDWCNYFLYGIKPTANQELLANRYIKIHCLTAVFNEMYNGLTQTALLTSRMTILTLRCDYQQETSTLRICSR